MLWWSTSNSNLQKQRGQDWDFEGSDERQWDKTGLDESKVGDLVKSHWRHVRSHLYFTSASHMYTLLNTLKLGVGSLLLSEGDLSVKEKLDSILRLDFMSHFVFRLFENLNVNEEDPNRFKLEIMVNRGAIIDTSEIQDVKDHTIPINLDNYFEINKKLNLEKLDMFLAQLTNLSSRNESAGPKATKEKSKSKNASPSLTITKQNSSS